MALQQDYPNLPVVIEGRSITMPTQEPLSVEVYRERRNLIAAVVEDMEEGVDFGIIPGTHDKSLWEPGAERLRFGFNIQFTNMAVDEREDFEKHEYYYRYLCTQLLGPGINGPSWEASAWSKERKFWCKGGRGPDACPNPCDAAHGPKGMEAFMLPHNVRDRAQKRAFVAMIRNVTGATGLFKGSGADKFDSSDDMPAQDEEFASGGSNDHPWLVTCPVHNVKWFKTAKMREPAHRMGEDPFGCNQSQALKEPLDNELRKIAADSWGTKELTAWIKDHFQKTWSQLSPKVKLDVIEEIKHTPPPSARKSEPEPGVDEETGVITSPESGPLPPDQGSLPLESEGSTVENIGQVEH